MTVRQHLKAAQEALATFTRHMELAARGVGGEPLPPLQPPIARMIRIAELLGLADKEVELDG